MQSEVTYFANRPEQCSEQACSNVWHDLLAFQYGGKGLIGAAGLSYSVLADSQGNALGSLRRREARLHGLTVAVALKHGFGWLWLAETEIHKTP